MRSLNPVVFALLLCCGVASTASAFVLTAGEPWDSNSWSLPMKQVLGGPTYNFMRMDVFPGGNLFELPNAAYSLSSPWSVKYESTTSIIVSREGNQTADFYWTWKFASPRTTVHVHFATYDGDIWREGGEYFYYTNGTELWTPDNDWDPGTDIPGVPEPTSLLLIGVGAALAGLKRRHAA